MQTQNTEVNPQFGRVFIGQQIDRLVVFLWRKLIGLFGGFSSPFRVTVFSAALFTTVLLAVCYLMSSEGVSVEALMLQLLAPAAIVIVVTAIGRSLPEYFRVDARISRKRSIFLGVLPIVAVACFYVYTSEVRHAANKDDKQVPTLAKLGAAVLEVVRPAPPLVAPEIPETFWEHTFGVVGRIKLLTDTIASGKRFLIAFVIIFAMAVLGVSIGTFPKQEALFHRFFNLGDKFNAISLLPIAMVLLGYDEWLRIGLIVLGVYTAVILDSSIRAKEVPLELIHKAMSLGATHFEVFARVILPQVFPNVLNCIRLSLKPMISFLLVGEMSGATEGLGCRIFMLRRLQRMDVTVIYILWITFLLYSIDWLIQQWISRKYSWLNK